MDEDREPPTEAMIQHLAQRLVDRYGRDAPGEAAQVVTLLKQDGNDEQADIWSRVMDACGRIVAKPGQFAGKR